MRVVRGEGRAEEHDDDVEERRREGEGQEEGEEGWLHAIVSRVMQVGRNGVRTMTLAQTSCPCLCAFFFWPGFAGAAGDWPVDGRHIMQYIACITAVAAASTVRVLTGSATKPLKLKMTVDSCSIGWRLV